MATKITWPLDVPDDVTLTVNPDGTQSASYIDNQGNAKAVVVNPDGSRDQILTMPSGATWTIRYEISNDGVLLQRTVFSDGTVFSVTIYPGGITHSIGYLNPDNTASEVTYFTLGLEKRVDKGADGRTTTVITNPDGIQRIAVQP